MHVHAKHADAAGAQMEIRLLNKASPVVIGKTANDPVSMEAVAKQLAIEPSGLTPTCKYMTEFAEYLKSMEANLIAEGKIAMLIIMTDGESTDGNVVDMLKPLEGLPLKVVIRMCTDEAEVTEYWQNINAKVDLDIDVLDDLYAESVEVGENNPWLTYGEPLHRAREFGIMVPVIDVIDKNQLTKSEIKSLIELL